MSSPSSSKHLGLNDAVTINSENANHLQGIVAHLGQVSFSDSKDWVGVRLTGSSIGKGKNDGSVKGKRYFENCAMNDGMFVKRSHLSKRKLSRLEELKLKRELSTAGPRGSPSAASKSRLDAMRKKREEKGGMVQPSSRSGSTTSALASLVTSGGGDDDDDSSVVSTSTSASRRKLEDMRMAREIRLKKAANQSQLSAPSSRPDHVLKTIESGIQESGPPVDTRSEQLREEITSLKSKLQLSEQLAEKYKADLEESKLKVQRSHNDGDIVIGGDIAPTAEAGDESSTSDNALVNKLTAEIKTLEERLTSGLSEISSLQDELSDERDDRNTQISTLESKLTTAYSRATTAEREANIATEQASQRTNVHSELVKDKARLTGEVSSLTRRLKELETDAQDHDALLEDLTLDKDQLEEEKLALEEQVEDLTLDLESLQMESEELKSDFWESRDQASKLQEQLQAMSGGDSNESADGVDRPSGSSPETPGGGTGTGADADDVARALGVQNARLREALIRLREQSSVEKVELIRQMKSLEKNLEENSHTTEEHSKLKERNTLLESQISELKDMVDVASGYDGMIEQLSDRVADLEDTNRGFRNNIAELEEVNEVGAEMEEMQAEENKVLLAEHETMETKVRNLEEAIKMQRKRESDFQRTSIQYRTMIETLRHEKAALLESDSTQSGEKSHLVALSQRALAQAAQMVADQSAQRKREADAAFLSIDVSIQTQTVKRLEAILPVQERFVSVEFNRMKQEMLLARIVRKVAVSLESVKNIFTKKVSETSNFVSAKHVVGSSIIDPEKHILSVSDEDGMRFASMVHQAKFATTAIDASADTARLFCTTQWPDLFPPEESGDRNVQQQFGSVWVAPYTEVDAALSHQLRSLKVEGMLSPHTNTSALTVLSECVESAKTAVSNAKDEHGHTILEQDWTPPGWDVVKHVAKAQYTCLGISAAVSCCVRDPTQQENGMPMQSMLEQEMEIVEHPIHNTLLALITKLEQITRESSRVTDRLSGMPIANNPQDEKLMEDLKDTSRKFRSRSDLLLEASQTIVVEGLLVPEKMENALKAAEETWNAVSTLMNQMKEGGVIGLLQQQQQQLTGAYSADATSSFSGNHPLSPESNDAFENVKEMVAQVFHPRYTGSKDDLKMAYQVRASEVSQRLVNAIENEAQLIDSTQKVSSLEKLLHARTKEISMQNTRMTELEKLLLHPSNEGTGAIAASSNESKDNENAKNSAVTSSSGDKSSVEGLQRDNQVLSEAVKVLELEVEEYERKMDSLTNKNKARRSYQPPASIMSPNRKSASGINSKDSSSSNLKHLGLDSASASREGSSSDIFALGGGAAVATLDGLGKATNLEAAFFRPALQSARADAAKWKSNSVSSTMASLAPLTLPDPNSFSIRSKYGVRYSSQPQEGHVEVVESKENGDDDFVRYVDELTVACREVRLAQALTSVVDLSSSGKDGMKTTTHSSLNYTYRKELRTKYHHHTVRLQRMNNASMAASGCLAKARGLTDLGSAGGGNWFNLARAGGKDSSSTSNSANPNQHLMGRVKLCSGDDGSGSGSKVGKSVTLDVNRGEVRQLLLACF
eukprot:CAMPEP_0194353680 /NCGR_PEP_ID=MMETSP0174-20130528/1962_1 /TAXON_ID=216777 /ORGANISM="Proboscia alata, Strain PI-D3" /LENGTH=1578 /DNA_ID=CAMNT_0039122335 /DNA_START=264 /DNA_END=5000 /DNA_ORIENTATION=+